MNDTEEAKKFCDEENQEMDEERLRACSVNLYGGSILYA